MTEQSSQDGNTGSDRWALLPGVTDAAFICGCGHTGTTLLATILSAHPGVYVPLYESGAFLWRPERSLRELGRLADDARAAGKTYLIEKSPKHVRHLQRIREALPGCRFVIMVRDGRDVAASIGNRLEGDYLQGLNRWIADTWIALQERGHPDVRIVRYEDLIAAPQQSMTETCAFLQIPYLPALLEYHREPHLWYGRDGVRESSGVGPGEHEDLRNWQVNQPIFDGRGKRRQMLPDDIREAFSGGVARSLMEAFGYDS